MLGGEDIIQCRRCLNHPAVVFVGSEERAFGLLGLTWNRAEHGTRRASV